MAGTQDAGGAMRRARCGGRAARLVALVLLGATVVTGCGDGTGGSGGMGLQEFLITEERAWCEYLLRCEEERNLVRSQNRSVDECAWYAGNAEADIGNHADAAPPSAQKHAGEEHSEGLSRHRHGAAGEPDLDLSGESNNRRHRERQS